MNDINSTGIPELDELLGGGVAVGSVVLVKGGPGAGKTTMCAQIMAEALKKEQNCLFVSVEERPFEALGRVGRCFTDLSQEVRTKHLKTLAVGQIIPDEEIEDLPTAFLQFWERVFTCASQQHQGPIQIIVIDGLSALVDAVISTVTPAPSNRQVFRSISQAFASRQFRPFLADLKGTLYVTAEPSSLRAHLHGSESYLADVVVHLSEDEIRTSPAAKRPERLRFCTVLKARDLRNQRRRCCYDFSAKGLSFFPTYAAEGRLSLFWENAPQHELIERLEREEIPELYPLVSVEPFTKSGLQTLFSLHRQATKIPLRRSMTLCTIDEYWIKVLGDMQTADHPLLETLNPKDLKLYLANAGDRIIDELVDKGLFIASGGDYLAVPYFANVGMFVGRSELLGGKPLPNTWEDVEDICKTGGGKMLIEMGTYDSFMTFIFEWLWSHGAVFSGGQTMNGTPKPLDWPDGRDLGIRRAIEALERLNRWVFVDQIIPLESSVDAAQHEKGDWVFARHWYSTLIEVLYTCNTKTNDLVRRTFETDNVDLGSLVVGRMPISATHLSPDTARHHSAWGEWYLALLGGSENKALALDIINNLMTSGRIVHRALAGAGLPTVDIFYKQYGSRNCPGTQLSFDEVRATFFQDALSRTIVANYPRVARILYGACSAIVSRPQSKSDIDRLVKHAFAEIDSDRN